MMANLHFIEKYYIFHFPLEILIKVVEGNL